MDLEFTAELWRWEARSDDVSGWVFATVPVELADELRLRAGPPRGFGSIRVEVRIGSSVWRTSVFPSAETGSFALPVKKAVRDAEGVDVGDVCSVSLRCVDAAS